MDFDSIGDFSGFKILSQNMEFMMIWRDSEDCKTTTFLIAENRTKKPIYAYRTKYASNKAISNNGYFAAIANDFDQETSTIYCIDDEGGPTFSRLSNSNPSCLAFDNDNKYLVVSFAGDSKYIESYSTIWFDINSGQLIKAEQNPDLKPIFSMSFDSSNKLVLKPF